MSRDRVVSIALVLCTIVGARAAEPFDSTLILSSSKDERVAQDKRSDVADAVMKGDKAALRTLLQQKADVNAPQADGATALHWAVFRGDLDENGRASCRERV